MSSQATTTTADEDRIRVALSDPAFYPQAPETVEVRETHISRVFLAGDRAYKVKKPVALPFVDYSTLERRLALCAEEVRLNRRLAPHVYLGVRAIVEKGGELAWGAADDPDAVEYAVEMRRFSERDTLRSMLERGEATRAQLEQLGERLARFHATAAPRKPAAAAPRQQIASTLVDLALDPGGEQIIGLEGFTASFLARHGVELEGRRAAGLVRDGHGDLRLEHVICEGGNIAVVDCAEFDPALRAIDVAYDVAFLLMELEEHGAPQLADALIAGYRAEGGDPASAPTRAFFAAQRALVRAKVAEVRAHQLIGADRGRAERQAEELISLARRLAWRARGPIALVVCGPPASGKSHLAAELARISGFDHLRSDHIRKDLAGIDPTVPARPEHYTAEFTARTYRELARQAHRELGKAGGVILDATYRHRDARRMLGRRLGAAAPVFFVHCTAPRAVLLHRAERRRHERSESDATPTVVARLAEEFEDLDEVAPDLHVCLRTDRQVDEVAAELEAVLDLRMSRPSVVSRNGVRARTDVAGASAGQSDPQLATAAERSVL